MVLEQVHEAQRLLDALVDLEDGHVAFFLLRTCFGSSLIAYALRCMPTEASIRVAELYDLKLENIVPRLLDGVLPKQVFQELQLPVKSPGPSFGIGTQARA